MIIQGSDKFDPNQAPLALTAVGFLTDSEYFDFTVDVFNGNPVFGQDGIACLLFISQWMEFAGFERNNSIDKELVRTLIAAI